MAGTIDLPTGAAIQAARLRIASVAKRTELSRFDAGSRSVPSVDTRPIPQLRGSPAAELYLKLENTQPIGSFKIRGAANAMANASDEQLAGGVWTASAGNMAQGVAWCARERDILCRVVVPEHASRTKTDAVLALGAEVIPVPFDAWWNAMLSRSHPGMTGLMVHPFADTHVMAGNGTIGLELAEDAPDLDAVLVPWGGGGLACGIAAALREVSPRTKVYAVEVETAAPLTASLAAGKPVVVHRTRTFIDGMGSDRLSDEIWPLVPGLIAGTVVVTVAQVAVALRLMAETANVIAEGAGAATVAAALGGRVNGVRGASLEVARVACIVSGGNIDAEVVRRILRGEEG
ncbi:MAG: pyridoxal-phosphate dependent enzyme [Gemmatimonadetes bacterium]|nr:pyridoxal-phosphate dependent enzyme [Gemmatimonadota bacterium]